MSTSRIYKSSAHSMLRLCSASRRSLTTSTTSPLRILFCGSDDFSSHSLSALSSLSNDLVQSITVLTRPPRPTGRGLKKLTYPPIHALSTKLNLPILTPSSLKPPPAQLSSLPIDLIIAVSYGLLIPPSLLSLSSHGGINLHPSFLPDLHGPAPLQHALLAHDSEIGITLQTLHPTTFDRGRILYQTPRGAGYTIPQNCTLSQAVEGTGVAAAKILTDWIRNGGVSSLPSAPTNTISTDENVRKGRYAGKLTIEDRRFSPSWTKEQVFTRDRVLGELWDVVTFGKLAGKEKEKGKRMIYYDWRDYSDDMTTLLDEKTTRRVVVPIPLTLRSTDMNGHDGTDVSKVMLVKIKKEWRLVFKTKDGSWIGPEMIKVEGNVTRHVSCVIQGCIERWKKLH